MSSEIKTKMGLGRHVVEGIVISKKREYVNVRDMRIETYPMEVETDDGFVVACSMPLTLRRKLVGVGSRIRFSIEITSLGVNRSSGLRPTQSVVLKYPTQHVKNYLRLRNNANGKMQRMY